MGWRRAWLEVTPLRMTKLNHMKSCWIKIMVFKTSDLKYSQHIKKSQEKPNLELKPLP